MMFSSFICTTVRDTSNQHKNLHYKRMWEQNVNHSMYISAEAILSISIAKQSEKNNENYKFNQQIIHRKNMTRKMWWDLKLDTI